MVLLATLVVEYTVDLGDLERGTQKAIALIEKFEKAASSAGTGASKLADAQMKAAQAADKVKAAQTSASSALEKVDQAAKKAAMSMTKTADKASHMSSSLSKIKSVGSSAASAFGSVGSGAAKAGGSLLDFASKLGMSVMGAKELAGAAIELGSAMLKPHASLENLTTGLGTLLKSDSATQAMIADLKEFAALAPAFDLVSAGEGAQKLLAMGFAAGDVMPLMNDIGNAIAGMGGSASDLTDVAVIFGQINSVGKLTYENVLQLAERGFVNLEQMAKNAGMTTEEMMKQMSDGAISAEEGIALIRQTMKQTFGDNAMAEQAKTFDGAVANMQANLENLWMTLSKPVFDAAKEGLQGFNTLLENPAIQQFAEGAGKAFADFMTKIGEMAAKAAPHFQALGEKIAPIVMNIIAWMDKNDVFEKVMQTMFNIGSSLADTFGELADVVGPMVADFLKWAEENHVLEITLAAIEGAVKGVGEVLKFAAPIVAEIIKKAAEFGKEIADRLQPSIEKFSAWWNENWPHIQQVFEGVWKGIQGVAEVAWSIISGIFKIGLDIFNGDWEQAWEDAKAMFAGIWEGIKKIFSGWWDIISGIVKTAWNTYLAKPFDELRKAVTDWWDGLVKSASEIGGKIIDAIASGIKNFGGGLGDAIKAAVRGAAASLGITLPNFAEGVTNFSGGLAVVGERGPELVYLPQHSSVIPMTSSPARASSVSASKSSNAQMSGDIYVSVQIGDEQLVQMVAERMDNRVRAKHGAKSRVA